VLCVLPGWHGLPRPAIGWRVEVHVCQA
jgi:hypothetical protein